MTEGPISAVPGFVRDEAPPPPTRATPLIDAVPVISLVPGEPPSVPVPPSPPQVMDTRPVAADPIVSAAHGPTGQADQFADLFDDDIEATRRAAPARPVVTMAWDDGTVASVTSTAVFGRNPVAEPLELTLQVADATMSLSKTHGRVRAQPASIEDLHSTNGVTIERGGSRTEATPGVPMPLRAGDVIIIGARRAVVEVSE